MILKIECNTTHTWGEGGGGGGIALKLFNMFRYQAIVQINEKQIWTMDNAVLEQKCEKWVLCQTIVLNEYLFRMWLHSINKIQ